MLILALACGSTLGKKLDKRCVNCTYRTYYTYGDGRSQQRVIYQDPYYTRGIYSFWDSELTDEAPTYRTICSTCSSTKRGIWHIAWAIVNPTYTQPPHTLTHRYTSYPHTPVSHTDTHRYPVPICKLDCWLTILHLYTSCPAHTSATPLSISAAQTYGCSGNPCGVNAVCQEASGGRPVCSCPPGYSGNPLTHCNRGECLDNVDCRGDLQCKDNRCVNPCVGACGIGSNCDVSYLSAPNSFDSPTYVCV